MKFEEKVEKLLTVMGGEDQKRLEEAIEGNQQTEQVYQEKRTSEDRRSWFAAKRKLHDVANELWTKHMVSGKLLRNRAEAYRYLKDQGLKVSRRMVYLDAESGKLRVQADGTVLLSDLDLYARAYLGGRASGGGVDALTRRKLALEIERLEHQVELQRLSVEREQGKILYKKDLYRELATRAVVLTEAIHNLFISRAQSWVEKLRGDPSCIPVWLESAQRELDEQLANYANIDSFEVIFDEPRTETKTDPHERASALP
jgi:hypothetical protein